MPILGATIFAFIADITNDQNRTIRMGFVTASILTGVMAGTYASRYVLEWTSVTALFVMATCCIVVGLVYIALFVEDSIVPSADSELGSSLANLFSTGLVREIVQSGRRKRSRFVWVILWLVVVTSGLMELAAGSGLVGYKFTHRKFEWGRHQYGHFQLVDQSLVILANLVGIPMLKKVIICNFLLIDKLTPNIFSDFRLARHAPGPHLRIQLRNLFHLEGIILKRMAAVFGHRNDWPKRNGGCCVTLGVLVPAAFQ